MSKKILISVIALVALFGASLPVAAQEPEEEEKEPIVVPNDVQISDPPGDANYYGGDYQAGNIGPSGSDILKAWFTNDERSISAHIQTAEPMDELALYYAVRTRPESISHEACIVFAAWMSGNGAASGSSRVDDTCEEEEALRGEGEAAFEEGPGGTGILTITVPRSSSPRFEKDSILFAPTAESRHHIGTAGALIIDSTQPGSDYTVVGERAAPPEIEEPEEGEEGEEPEEEPEEEEEPEQSEPPKKKKKGKKGKGCPAMTPHEKGAEAETTVVTEEATEEKPIEIPVEAPPGLWPASTGDVYHNIQVDTAAGERGLFVRYEFPDYEDLDLYLYEPGNDEAVAQAAGFNPFPFVPGETDGTGNGGHSEMGAEQIDGFPTADCVGYTAEMHSFISEGGEYTLKLWLGDPAEEEEE